MTALFPTYTSLWHRVKRLWERFLDACEADEQRYINESRAKGLDDFDFGFGTFR